MEYQIKRTKEEIDEQMNRAGASLESGSRYPGMSYEDGMEAMFAWLVGERDDKPIEDN